jgi:hypothetical protein
MNKASGTVPKAWILLDNQSTVDVFYNKNLLVNIRNATEHMDIHCNAGVTITNLIRDLPRYGQIVLPNILSNIGKSQGQIPSHI